MFAKADIIVDRADSSIIIPKDVILSNRRRKYVYIVEKNTAKIRNLQTGSERMNIISKFYPTQCK